MRRPLIFLIFSIFISCAEVDLNLSPDDLASNTVFNRLSTKTENFGYFLRESDIMKLVHLRTLEDKAKELDFVNPIYIEESELPVAYVIQYTDGWEVVAADKRVYPTICESKHGAFSEQDKNENFHGCLRLSELDIAEWFNVTGDLWPKDEKVQWNLNFWQNLLNPKFSNESNAASETKAVNPFARLTTPVLVDVIVDTIMYDTIPHLITTHWHQRSPYNVYAPYTNSSLVQHCPAGCVAVSGGQMLYFLHDKFGVPTSAPMQCTTSGYIPHSFVVNPSNIQPYAWSAMNVNDNYVAILLADVAKRVGMNFGENGSSASTSNLPPYVFEPYGIRCNFSNFQVELVQNSLMDGLPVVARASSSVGGGHSFIIDRYESAT